MSQGEEAFPRGGKQVLSALERKRLRSEAQAEARQDLLNARPEKRRRPGKQIQEDDDELLAFSREASQGRLPKYVELLKFKNLTVGSKIWGCVLVVSSKGLTVSLPDGLKGFVPISQCSDFVAEALARQSDQVAREGKSSVRVPALQTLFRPGQYVTAIITALDKKPSGSKGTMRKKVVLSLKVAALNEGISPESLTEGQVLPACVSSIEDHGYMLDLGIKGSRAFLDREGHTEGAGGSISLIPGALVDVLITKAADKRLLRVIIDPESVTSTVTKEWKGLTIGTLQPGALVNVKVRKILSDGLIVSFLTYFHGVIDLFHLSQENCSGDWKESFSEGQKLRARVLFVDPAAKSIFLSLLPHLKNMSATSDKLPEIGSLIKKAVVQRVDENLGVLLSLPGFGGGYAHISDIADEKVDKLSKILQVSQDESARVIGSRLMDGLAIVSLKPSAIEQFLMGAIKPGQEVKGKVVLVQEKGLLVNIAKDVNAFVPNEHISDLGEKQGKTKNKVDSAVTGRVLTVDPARKRASLTLKKSLVNSKLKPLTAWEDVKIGAKAMGVVVSVMAHGCLVRFFGDVKGMIHASELGLSDGQNPSDAYTTGQVVKTRILGLDPAAKKIQLTLAVKKAKAEQTAQQPLRPLQPGDLYEARIANIEKDQEGLITGYGVDLLEGNGIAGTARLEATHLYDNPGANEAVQETLQVGSSIGKAMVLQQLSKSKTVLATCKPSLLEASGQLPKELEDLREATIVPGYVTNVISHSVFVRFLNGLTGRAGLAQLSDTFVSDPQAVFAVGQSVKARIVEVDAEKRQFSVSLKPSVTGNHTAAYLASLLQSLELAARIKSEAETEAGEEAAEWDRFAVGATVQAVVHEEKDYGTIVDLVDDPNLVGLIPLHQMEEKLEVGDRVGLRVMDVNKVNGIVELTAKKELLDESAPSPQSKKAKKDGVTHAFAEIAAGTPVECIVQIARESYAVVSYGSQTKSFATVCTNDFNVRDKSTAHHLTVGSRQSLIWAIPPSPETGNRAVLEYAAPKAPRDLKRQRREKMKAEAKIKPGTVLAGSVIELNPVFVVVELPEGMLGRLHACEVADAPESEENPFSGWQLGRRVEALVLGVWQKAKRSAQHTIPCFELSVKPSLMSASPTDAVNLIQKRPTLTSLSHRTVYTGFVTQVAADYLLVALSPTIIGRVFILDAASDPKVLNSFQRSFQAGQAVQCRVLKVDKDTLQIDLTLVVKAAENVKSSIAAADAVPGDVLMGKIVRGQGPGLRIQVGPHTFGSASFFELRDKQQENVLEGFEEDTCVRCIVLEGQQTKPDADNKKQKRSRDEPDESPAAGPGLKLSLRKSRLSKQGSKLEPRKLERGDLKVGLKVTGYVKNISKYGIFVCLSDSVDARVKLGNLSESFIEEPASVFPKGKRVEGRIISISGERVEMSLKPVVSKEDLLDKLKEGQIVKGTIQTIKDYGLFVQLQHSPLVGFVHKSLISDKFVKDIGNLYKPGQGVRARVVAVDPAEGKLKLGLKQSFFVDDDLDEAPAQEDDVADEGFDLEEDMLEAADVDSEDGQEWRTVAAESPDSAADSGNEEEGLVADSSDAELEEEDQIGEEVGQGRPSKRQKASAGEAEELEDDLEEEEESVEEEDEGDELETSKNANGYSDNGPFPLTSGGVGWGDDESADDKPDATPSAPEEGKQLSKRQLKRQKKEAEEKIRKAELASLEGKTQSSAADFEKELMGSPNSSYLWIKYMAFQISLGEVDKARAIAEQALQRIHYREEGEKFNIWQARLNLEMQYGEPPEEAVMKLFQRALSYTDQKKLYLALTTLLERSDKEELLKQTYKAMHRKYPESAKVWLRQIAYFQKKGDPEAALKMLHNATQSAPTRKHIKILRQAALQAFSFELPEQGRSIFEGLMRNYPKRLDLWSVYLDQEIKLGDSSRIRNLFDRATSMQIPPKKIKFLFKRYLDYESKHGSAATVSQVKQAAKAYVEQHLALS